MLPILVALNIAMQLFDGVATYVGWERHGELNPLLRSGFEHWGPASTLVVAKLVAVALVLSIARFPRPSMATQGLALTFLAYTVFSFVPWSARLLGVPLF